VPELQLRDVCAHRCGCRRLLDATATGNCIAFDASVDIIGGIVIPTGSGSTGVCTGYASYESSSDGTGVCTGYASCESSSASSGVSTGFASWASSSADTVVMGIGIPVTGYAVCGIPIDSHQHGAYNAASNSGIIPTGSGHRMAYNAASVALWILGISSSDAIDIVIVLAHAASCEADAPPEAEAGAPPVEPHKAHQATSWLKYRAAIVTAHWWLEGSLRTALHTGDLRAH
jgi:hypothetical protein